MATQESSPRTGEARQTVLVDTFTDGLLGPEVPMLGPVADGGHIVWNPTPGCWGPMITPSIRGGHEVCQPVAVEGAKPGDAVAIRIKDIEVTSLATSSGNDQAMEGRFNGDPYIAAGVPGLRHRVAGDPRGGHRAGVGALRELRRGLHAVHVHQRLHDRVRRAALRRRHRPARGGRGLRPRGRARRGAARQLRAEPDPRLRAARHRRRWPRGCARSWARSGRRRRRRSPTPTTRATSARS